MASQTAFEFAPPSLVLGGPVFVVRKEPAKPSIQERFEQFHADNPAVYEEMVAVCRELKATYGRGVSAKFVWEKLRLTLRAKYRGRYMLDNSLTSRYAREVMRREPDLAGFFQLRDLKS